MATATRWTMRLEPYDPDARDADNDGIIQEQTPWERPAGTRLVDELGRAITRGANAGQRPRGLRVVDQRGNPVDYTPTYERPGFSFGGGGTPLGEAGAPSLRERGLPSVRDITAPPPAPQTEPIPAPSLPLAAVLPGADGAQSSNKVITDPNDVDLYYYPGNRMQDNTWVRREELDESFEDFISGLTDSEKETALRELGFESEDELVRHLTDETLTDVAEQIDSLRKTPIMMALPPDALLSILRDQRFNSQFVTGTSVGGYNPEGRKESEFEKLGVPVDIPDELRPVYGFQVPDDYEGPVTESPAGKIYGSLVVVFKKSPRGRSTMTGGDSVLEDRVSAISVDGRVQDEALLGAAREDHYALGQARTENKFFTDVLNSPERQGELIDIESRDYSEVQIHGGATLDEVEKVVFSRRLDAEARAKVVAELEKAGIRYEDDKQ